MYKNELLSELSNILIIRLNLLLEKLIIENIVILRSYIILNIHCLFIIRRYQ